MLRWSSMATTGLRRDLGTIESYATLLGILIGAGIFKVTGQAWRCMILGVSLIVLIAPGLFALHRAYFTPFFTHGPGGFAASLPPLFFAYAGFESLAQTAGEVSDSTRRLPRVFVRGICATLVIYFLMSLVGLGTLSPDRLRVSTAPMAEAAASYVSVGGAAIVTIGALMALLTSVNATMLVPSRIAIVLAQEKLAPRGIGGVSPETGRESVREG